MNIIKSLLTSLILSFVFALGKGTIMWFCFPYINYLFPTAIENGILPPTLNWWACVCISWMVLTLFNLDQIKVENKFILKEEVTK